MPTSLLAGSARPCIWMSAGLVAYKLCDCDFDCDRCPLDAALRGGAWSAPGGTAAPDRRGAGFPDDRLYTPGHLWLQPVRDAEDGLLRCGLDAFAAALLGRCRRVSWPPPGSPRAPGETVCELDAGAGRLPLAVPLACRLRGGNPALAARPELALTRPYDVGWLVELETGWESAEEGAEEGGIDGLLTPEAAREGARLDLRLFRRRVALRLLAGSSAAGPTLQDGGAPLTDLRRILGDRAWLELLRELVH